jgi:APA family basic amino acid/polyamine antiporter
MAVAATPPRQGRGHLLKILGVTFGIAIAVGNVIGSGIMRAPSSIAATVPDTTWIIGLWVLGGLHAALGANVLAELGTAVPQSGGPYLYAHRAFGDVAGLIVGWSIFIAQLAGIAAASIAFSEFLPLLWPAAAGFKLVTAIGMQLVLYGTNIAGLREGRVVQESTSLIKALLLLAFAGAAIAVAGPNGAAGSAVGPAPAFGWMAVIGAYALIKGAYSGWDAPVYFTEENEQPASSVPNALFIGLMITASLYILVNSTLLYALGPVATGATALPFSAVLDRIGGPLPGILFAAGAMITVFGVANANIMSSPRLLFAMARDGLLPPFFGSVNRGGTPDMAMLTVAAGTIALAATGSFVLVFGLIAMLGTVASILVGAAIFVLRRREPDLPRPFRAFGYPVLPALALIIDIALLVLFSSADYVGLAFAAGLSALCVPLAIIARRANAKGRQ